jgi:hypothetical protein
MTLTKYTINYTIRGEIMADQVPETTELVTEEDSHDGYLLSGLPSEALAELTPAKTRMILLYITGQYNLTKIAQIIGVTDATIRAWLGQPAVQQVMQELQKREWQMIDAALKSLRFRAVDTMDRLMDSPMDAVRFQASKDILDRTGHKAVNEIKVDKTVTTIEQQLKEIADVVIDESEIIDITDVVEQVKSGYESGK